MSDNEVDHTMPPPSSQSHFATFANFTPEENAPFDDEFARLASSQDWVPGSQEYTRERTIAMSQEIKLHYFSSQPKKLGKIDEEAPQETSEDITEEQKLEGYKELCREVGITPSDSIAECKRQLKSTLVNIVDLIDTRRTGKEVKVWEDFEAFRNYTLQDEHRIDPKAAHEDGGFLASLLQRLRGSRRRRRGGRKKQSNSGVVSGRIAKTIPA